MSGCERCESLLEEIRQYRYGVAALVMSAGGHIQVSDVVKYDVMGGDYEIIHQVDPRTASTHFYVKPPVRSEKT